MRAGIRVYGILGMESNTLPTLVTTLVPRTRLVSLETD